MVHSCLHRTMYCWYSLSSRAEEVSRDVQVLKLKDELQDANRKLAQLDKVCRLMFVDLIDCTR